MIFFLGIRKLQKTQGKGYIVNSLHEVQQQKWCETRKKERIQNAVLISLTFIIHNDFC